MDLNILPKTERDLLLYTSNQTTVAIPLNRCLHQLFEEQVNLDGQAIAVEFEGWTLSYDELNVQSNQLAHYLIANGVKPDDLVALCAERSISMVIAILAILKSGGAYVPIDPAYPSKRLTQILRDAKPKLLLADATGRNVLGEHQVPVIEFERPLPTDLSCDNPDAIKLGLTPNHLAYVLYTSGSTGKPKGVTVEHRAVTQLFKSVHEKFGFVKGDKFSLFHSISFSLSVWETWVALMNGSRLSIVPQNIVNSPDDFYDWLCFNGITVLRQTPSVFKMLMRSKNIGSRYDRLRCIVFGGEALDAVILREWFEKFDKNKTMLANLYGSTEATTNAVCWIDGHEMSENGFIPLGHPLPTKRIYLLDAQGEPVPTGTEGEIFIGGDAIARGYLNQPELTAERFLSDPFSDEPAARMYRTGDRARYLPDGNLIYLGRTDHQVKIRGFRIELGEIETHLVAHPQVSEAIVETYGNGSNARLVAYVVTDADTSIAQDLRNYLSALLPEYMVPAAYVRLLSFPLTPNGKLDRRALPAPGDDAFVRRQYEAPQSEMEEKLVDIWCKLLAIERISRLDNFFELGGHSLLAVQLLAQLRQIGLNTTVRDVFDSPNLATLATTLTRYQAVEIPPNLINAESTQLTPEMLPLITLSQSEIDEIIAQIPDGVANIQDIYGLTPLQNIMLFHHLKAEVGDPFLIVRQLSFIDRTALERYANIMQKLIERHDVLRTVFIWEGLNEPAQIVLRRVPSLLTEITLDQSDNTVESVLEHLCHKFSSRHYRLDLTQAPLLRLMAAPTTDGNWVALEIVHHSIIDYSALQRLRAEILTISEGKIEDLTATTSFRYVVAHARLGASLDEHKRFFTEMLGDVDEPTHPFGLSEVDQNDIVNKVNLILPQSLYDQLRTHARRLRVSVASICHLAWAQVLARASGREAVVFGTVLLGRSQWHTDTIGMMMNTLPLRLNVDETSIETAVRQTHARLSALMDHEHTPLVLAQRCSQVPHDLPLFSALLNYRHSQNSNAQSMPGVTVVGVDEQTNYPLYLSIDDDDSLLKLTVQAILPVQAIRICAYMQQVLESMTNAFNHTSQQPVRTLMVIPPEERNLLLHTWNQSTITYPPMRYLQQIFETQVERDGHAIAVECNGKSLSYYELNVQANRLAHFLIERDVKPDARIALCVERSTTLIVAMLAILKAGGAYLPLDPVYSSQRLKHILNDAKPILLLADATGSAALGKHQVPVIDIHETALFCDFPADNPNSIKLGLTPDHLAYVIYTSGSTGTPKGVMIEHRSLFSLVQAIPPFAVSSDSHIIQFASCSFDNSIWEIILALTTGAKLCMPYGEERQTDTALLKYIKDNRITHADLGPALFRNTENLCDLNCLQVLILGSEAPTLSLFSAIGQQTQILLYNGYGLTETSIASTFWLYSCDFHGESVPIGRPIPCHCRTYVLDSYGEPVPLGAEGELYIGGAGVARGYLNRPELTAERFLTDPFDDNPSARMYRTGDRVRYLPDGNLIYIGRIDQQVKIRGLRIELGEIEAHLAEHPQVQAAVVQPHGKGSNARLVAYVVADADTSIAQDWRTYLSNLLPDYMVPVAYVCLSSLPLTPNGKLDRRALPAPDDKAFVRQQYVAPQGEVEEKLADIWRELLSIDRISRHDNFFELGGHSLLVMHFINKAKLCNIHISTRGVFSFPILKDLAEQITKRTNRIYCDAAIPIRQYGTESLLFLLPDGKGDTSYAFELTRDIDKNVPVYVLPWPSPDDKQPSSIKEMAHAMIVRMKKIQGNGSYAIAGYSSGGILAYEIAKQLTNAGCIVSFLGLIDTYPPIANGINETEMFLVKLKREFPVFESIIDSKFWDHVIKLTLSEAIEVIKKTNIDLKNIDIQWEALLSKQRYNYQSICALVKFDPLPIKTHLFKATNYQLSLPRVAHLDHIYKRIMNNSEKLFNSVMLGWENFNISTDFDVIAVDGDHHSMMTDPKNRSLLGVKLTKSLILREKNKM